MKLDELAISVRVLFSMTAFFPHPLCLAAAAGHEEQLEGD